MGKCLELAPAFGPALGCRRSQAAADWEPAPSPCPSPPQHNRPRACAFLSVSLSASLSPVSLSLCLSLHVHMCERRVDGELGSSGPGAGGSGWVCSGCARRRSSRRGAWNSRSSSSSLRLAKPRPECSTTLRGLGRDHGERGAVRCGREHPARGVPPHPPQADPALCPALPLQRAPNPQPLRGRRHCPRHRAL